MKFLRYIILCLCSLLLLSCYDKQIEEVKARVETITLTDAEKVVADMQATLNDLEDLKTKVKPAIDELDSAKVEIDKRISELRTELQGIQGAAADALEHELDNRRDQAKAIDDAIKELDVKKIDARIEAIKSVMREIEEKKYDERLAALEAAAESFATLKDLAGVQTSLDKANSAIESVKSSLSGLGNAIVEQVASSLEEYKERIITWVSESEALAELFSQYYTAAEMDAKLQTINAADSTQNAQIAALQQAADEVQGKIEGYVTEAIEGAGGLNEFIAGQISALRGEIAALKTDIGKLIGDPEDLLTSAKETIVAAINEILDKFKSDTAYVNGVVGILKNDISCLEDADKAITGGADLSVTNLKILNDALVSLLETTGSKLDTNRLKTAVQNVQNAIVDCLTEGDVNAKLADYVTLDAAKAYALAKDFSEFDENYKEFFGIGTTPAPANSVLGRIATLNGYVGSGQINWAEDLTEAVNKIYSGLLAAQKTDSEKIDSAKADAIARKLIAGLVKEIIGEGKDASDIKTLLQSFVTASETFAKQLGSAEFEGEDISSALKAVQDKLDDYARTGHTHSYEDIEGFKDAIEAVVGKISDLNAELGASNLVDAINKLYALFDKYDSTGVTYNRTEANNILSSLQSVLAMAILEGEIAEGHETALSGFDSLNLSGLLASINAIIESETGILDTRLKNNFIDVLGDLVTEEDLAKYVLGEDFDKLKTFVGKDEKEISVLARLAALELVNITIEKDNYTKWTDAVSAVNTLLKARIERLEAIWSTFDELSNRFTALEKIAGDGFGQKSLTDSIQSIINRIGDIKGEKTVAQLISDLQNAETTLVDAVIKGDKGQFENLNLKKLSDAVKAINTDLNITGIDGVGLQAILNTLSTRLSGIIALIGDGFSTSYTIADAIKNLQDQIDALDDTYATDTAVNETKDVLIGELADAKQALIDAIMGKLAEGQEHHSLEEYSALNLKVLKDRLDNITVNAQKSLETIISDLSTRLDNINKLLNVTTGTDTSIVQTVNALKEKVNSPTEMWSIVSGAVIGSIGEIFKEFRYFINLSSKTTELINKLNNLPIGDANLSTGDSTNVTAALNGLYKIVINWDTSSAIEESKLAAAVEALRRALLGADNLSGQNIKSVAELIDGAKAIIGTPSDDQKEHFTTIFAGFDYIESIIDSYVSLLRNTLNSLVFIPEYDDGNASVLNHGSSSVITMDFKVNAKGLFFDEYKNGNYLFKAKIKGVGDELACSTSINKDILTVNVDVSGKGIKNGDRIAVMVYNTKKDGDNYMSPYVAVTNTESGSYLVVNPASGSTLKFNSKNPSVAQTITVLGGNYEYDKSDEWVNVERNGSTLSVTVDGGIGEDKSGSIVISSTDDPSEKYTITVQVTVFRITVGNVTLTGNDRYAGGKTIANAIGNNFGYSGKYEFEYDCDWLTNVKAEGSNLVLAFTANNTSESRTVIITVKSSDGTEGSFTVTQNKAEYTLSLGTLPDKWEYSSNYKTYTAFYASGKSYSIPVNSNPEYSGEYTVDGCPDWITDAKVENNFFKFTLADNKTASDRTSGNITISASTGDAVTFKITQPKISFSLDVSGIEGVSYETALSRIVLPNNHQMFSTNYTSIENEYNIPINSSNYENPSYVVSGKESDCFLIQPNIPDSSTTLNFKVKGGIVGTTLDRDYSEDITIHAINNDGPSITFKVRVN